MDKIIAGLDIGTSKIACVISNIERDGRLSVIGAEVCQFNAPNGIAATEIEIASACIKKVVAEAELMAGMNVYEVWVGIAGNLIQTTKSTGVVSVKSYKNVIDESDIDRAFEAAQWVSIPDSRKILHVIPQEFSVDDKTGIESPLGMHGLRLERQIHIFTIATNILQNIFQAVEKSGLRVVEPVFELLALGRALIETNEAQSGIAIIDIEETLATLGIFLNGRLCYSATITFDRSAITGKTSLTGPEAMFLAALEEIKKRGYAEKLRYGAVITGEDSPNQGVIELGEFEMDIPIRLACPLRINSTVKTAELPVFATAIGLCIYGAEKCREN